MKMVILNATDDLTGTARPTAINPDSIVSIQTYRATEDFSAVRLLTGDLLYIDVSVSDVVNKLFGMVEERTSEETGTTGDQIRRVAATSDAALVELAHQTHKQHTDLCSRLKDALGADAEPSNSYGANISWAVNDAINCIIKLRKALVLGGEK